MKVLKRVDEDLSSLSGKATRRKAELVALEKKVQKQNEKMLKLMEHIDSALERIDELEDLAETRDRRIRNLEEKVEELEGKALSSLWWVLMKMDQYQPFRSSGFFSFPAVTC